MSDEYEFDSHRQGYEELALRVREELAETFAQHGLDPALDPDHLYINGVNNLEERLVISSQSLTSETTLRILDQDPPSDWSDETAGIFRVPYSFEDEHRVPDMTVLAASRLIEEVYFRLA